MPLDQDRQATAARADQPAQLATLQADTDRCVKCALCLPVCPTYSLRRTETQSPRGRIALAQALARGDIGAADVRPAFDACLTCGACEQVCPAKVPYANVIDGARRASGGPSRRERMSAATLARPATLRLLKGLHRVTRVLPLPAPLARWRAMPGDDSTARPGSPVASTGATQTVTVLGGCLSPHFDTAAVAGLVHLVNAVGHRAVRVDGCCGALAQHTGNGALARRLGQQLFCDLDDASARKPDPILHIASGCGAGLRDLPRVLQQPEAQRVAERVIDPFAWLVSEGLTDLLGALAQRKQSVLLHEPCTQRNALRAGGAVRGLLGAIPGLDVRGLQGHGCCGAAGSHMLTQPDAAARLADALLDEIGDEPHDRTLLTANIGCAWHLRGALFDRRIKIDVMHPAAYLSRCLTTGNGQ